MATTSVAAASSLLMVDKYEAARTYICLFSFVFPVAVCETKERLVFDLLVRLLVRSFVSLSVCVFVFTPLSVSVSLSCVSESLCLFVSLLKRPSGVNIFVIVTVTTSIK